MKTGFINVGPGRCGTSWLYQLLKSHPEILLPVVKETEFFNHNWHRGSDWYEGLFPKRGQGVRVRGEISNMYYCDREALLKIKAYNPAIKIIFNVRNPYDLLESFLIFGLRRGLNIPRGEFVDSYPIGMLMGSGYVERLNRGCLSKGDVVSVLDAVMLSRFITDVYEIFEPKNIFIFNYELLMEDPKDLSRRIFEFLGVDSITYYAPEPGLVNRASEPRFKILGQLASFVASKLRRYQIYSVLTFLHNNRVVKRLVLKSAEKGNILIDDSVKEKLINEANRAEAILRSKIFR